MYCKFNSDGMGIDMNIKFDELMNYIDEVQEVALEIYGKYDLDKSMLWMTEEFGEFFKSIRKNEPKTDITEEMGDLLAWIICLGNILDIKISDALKVTMSKEIKRQLKTYKQLKYAKKLKHISINE